MDSRNVNFSIKKSQIHTHMLSLSQKLTKLDIAWKDKCCMGFWVWFPKNDPEWAFVYILYVFTAFSTPYWRLFCSAPSVVNLVSWSGKNWVGPCLYLEDLSQSLNRRCKNKPQKKFLAACESKILRASLPIACPWKYYNTFDFKVDCVIRN